jgi:hypothetical protein
MCAMGVHRNERCGASTMRASITLHTARERYLDSSVAGTDASSINPRLASCATPLLLARPHISTVNTFCAKAHQGCCMIYIFKQRIVAALHASLTSFGEKQCDRRHRSCQCDSSFELVFYYFRIRRSHSHICYVLQCRGSSSQPSLVFLAKEAVQGQERFCQSGCKLS